MNSRGGAKREKNWDTPFDYSPFCIYVSRLRVRCLSLSQPMRKKLYLCPRQMSLYLHLCGPCFKLETRRANETWITGGVFNQTFKLPPHTHHTLAIHKPHAIISHTRNTHTKPPASTHLRSHRDPHPHPYWHSQPPTQGLVYMKRTTKFFSLFRLIFLAFSGLKIELFFLGPHVGVEWLPMHEHTTSLL